MSGGADSAVTAAIAVDAIGAQHVAGIFMPTDYNPDQSRIDAQDTCDALGIPLTVLPIGKYYTELVDGLCEAGVWSQSHVVDVARQNVQARVRGLLLMAAANEANAGVIATSNRTETALGYFTLFGDSVGVIPAPLGDVYKTTTTYGGVVRPGVYELAHWRNQQAKGAGAALPVPRSVLTKPPSAELAPGQSDEATLGAYETIDPLLVAYLEHDASVSELVHLAQQLQVADPRAHVQRIVTLVGVAEFKRRQTGPKIKVGPVAFGRDRRMPIVNQFVETVPDIRPGMQDQCDRLTATTTV